MRARLARVAGLTARALSSRGTTDHPERTEDLLTVLKSDYGDDPSYAGGPPDAEDRLGVLVDVLGLDARSADLFAVAVAPDLDANLGLAFAALDPAAVPGAASVGVALELCGLGSAEEPAAAVLDPSGALCREGLVDVVGTLPWLRRPLRVPDRVRAHLAGLDHVDPAIAALVAPTPGFACPAATELAAHLDRGDGLVWLHARPGSATAAAATAAFTSCGVGALVVDLRLADPSEPVLPTLRSAALEAVLQGCGLVLAGAERLLDAAEATRAWRQLTDARVPVIAVGDRPWHGLIAPPPVVVAAVLTASERSEIWAEHLGTDAADLAQDRSVATMRIGPDQIAKVALSTRRLAVTRGVDLTADLVREAARLLRPPAAGAPAGPSQATSLTDLVLPERTMADLERLVGWATHRDEVLAHGNVHGKGGKGTGLTALFTGSPGTGKTLAAHAIADDLGLELLQIDLSAVVDKYIGETEKKLETIFVDAESRDVLLFFDEADSLFGSRSAVQDARDRYANQEVSYLLQRMEHFDGITILATNLRGNIDAAFSRRLNFVVHFPDPDPATRCRLWQQHLDQTTGVDPDDPVDVERLSEVVDLAGGDIRNVILAAAYDAACEGTLVGMRQVRAATAREYIKLGRRVPDL